MINKYFYNLSITIVGIVTAIFILTTVGGLFYIPDNPFFVLLPLLGGIYYLKKQSPENIDFLKQFLILLLIIMVSSIISIFVWDSSADGRWYHTATIILYKNGWLPVYQNYTDFARQYNVYPSSAFWGNCYVHFVEIIGTNIYKISNFIESTKSVNFIVLSTVFMYSYSVLREFKPQNKFIPLIFSFIVILNPICICQWFTNYIDLHIYFAFTLLVLTIISIELKQKTSKTDLFMFVCSSLMLAMTKLTGCLYLFIMCLLYFLYLFLRKRNIKNYIKTILIIGGLIALTGISPFYTNFRDYGYPFHPLFSKQLTNNLNKDMPYGFENMPITERFLRSTFSESVNSKNSTANLALRKPVKLKIPFTINQKSFMYTFSFPDIRVGGFGYFWSGILLLSLFYMPFMRFRNSDEKYLFWLITTIILTTTFSNPYCWWARYIPQLWLFSVFILFFGLLQENYKNKKSKILKLLLLNFIICSFIINSFIVLFQNTQHSLYISKLLKVPYEYIDSVKKPHDKILLMIKLKESDSAATDETIIPHLEEYYGKENIIYVPYDKKKVTSEEFLPVQYVYEINEQNYFFKIEQ